MKKIITTLALTLIAAATSFAGEVGDISIEALKEKIAANEVVVIDVNGAEKYAQAHVPGAVSYDDVKGDFAAVLPEDKGVLVVAYCGGPNCSAYKRAASAAAKLGYTNVKHMSAGISGWVAAGEATESGEQAAAQG